MSKKKMTPVTTEQKYMLEQFLLDKFPENKILVVIEYVDEDGDEAIHLFRNCCRGCALRAAHEAEQGLLSEILPDIQKAIDTHEQMGDKTKNQDASKN